ncbi:ribonuclease H-like domain-containing protein [Tanacetum coccineum]
MSRPIGLKRLRKVGMSRKVESSEDLETLGAPKVASKQGRGIADIDADNDVTLVDETQERQDDDLMFDTRVLDDDEMPVEAKVDGKDEAVTTASVNDSTAGEAVTTTSADDSVVPTTIKEITLAQTLIQIKVAKPKVVTTAATTTTTRPKARGVVVQEPSEFRFPQETQPSSSKDKGKEGIDREDLEVLWRIVKAKYGDQRPEYEFERVLWGDLKVMFEPDKRSDEMKRVNTFVAMGSEVQESKKKKEEGREETTKGSRKKMLRRKRAGKEQQKESSKKQKVEEEKESEEVDEIDEAELKKLLLIRADGSSKRYSSMIRMLQGIDREDLEALWRIVKANVMKTFKENLKILKMNIKFRGGLLGLKRLHGFLEVTTAQVNKVQVMGTLDGRLLKSYHYKDLRALHFGILLCCEIFTFQVEQFKPMGFLIDLEVLDKWQHDVILTLCQLEMYFPPSFFDVMVHLVSHIVREIKMCGPPSLRNMYPFERYMGYLKGYVRNRSRPKGSIAKGYVVEEVIEFGTNHLRDVRNVGIPQSRHKGRLGGVGMLGRKEEMMHLNDLHEAHFTILQHMTSIAPYIYERQSLLKNENSQRDNIWLAKKHNQTFSHWLKEKVRSTLPNVDKPVEELGFGLNFFDNENHKRPNDEGRVSSNDDGPELSSDINQDEDIHMTIQKGLASKDNKNKVCKLVKSLYGLKQAPRKWNEKLVSVLNENGFVQSANDHSLFTKSKSNKFIALLVYVDDIDLGHLKYFLGIEVIKTGKDLCLSQRKYCLELLKDYGSLGCKPVSTLMETNFVLPYVPTKDDQLLDNLIGYQKLLGALGKGIRYVHSENMNNLSGYSDADWAKCLKTRKSITGYCVFFNNFLISWKSEKQNTISKSSTEAEYRSLSSTACEII